MICDKCICEVPNGYLSDGVCYLCAPLSHDTVLEIVQNSLGVEEKLRQIVGGLEASGCAVGFDGKEYFVVNSYKAMALDLKAKLEAAEARNVELMGDIAKMERDIGLALTDYNDEKALREAAESRLAEAQKALQTCEREIIWLGLQAFPNRTQQEVIQHSPAIAEARAALPPSGDGK